MSPIYFIVDHTLPIMVIPEVKIHLDGHDVLTHTYNIFFDDSENNTGTAVNGETIIKNKQDDPNYYGFIAFEDPDRLFSYTPEGKKRLTRIELEEIIEQIKHYRDNPALWRKNQI